MMKNEEDVVRKTCDEIRLENKNEISCQYRIIKTTTTCRDQTNESHEVRDPLETTTSNCKDELGNMVRPPRIQEEPPSHMSKNSLPLLSTTEKDTPQKITCNNCNRSFSSKQSLTTHVKTSKSCLEKEKKKKIFECSFCHKVLSSKQMLLYHTGICPTKAQKEYESRLEAFVSTSTFKNTTVYAERSPEKLQSFYDTNIVVLCDMTDSRVRPPEKRSSLLYDVFPFVPSCCEIVLQPFEKVSVHLGIRLGMSNGWYTNVMLHPNLVEKGLSMMTHVVDQSSKKELRVLIFNMNRETYIICSDEPVVQLLFNKYPDKFNVQMSYTHATTTPRS